MRSMTAAFTSVLAAAAIAAGASQAAPAASGVAGRWIATGSFGKIVLTLRKTGSVYKGTYVQSGTGPAKTFKALGRASNADGAQQLTLTLTPGRITTLCGLRSAKLYCQTSTGLATFSRA
jgi:hypothetical protein